MSVWVVFLLWFVLCVSETNLWVPWIGLYWSSTKDVSVAIIHFINPICTGIAEKIVDVSVLVICADIVSGAHFMYALISVSSLWVKTMVGLFLREQKINK